MAENGYPLNIIGVEQNFSFPSVYKKQYGINNIGISIAQAEYIKVKELLVRDVSLVYSELQYLLGERDSYEYANQLFTGLSDVSEYKYDQGDIGKLELLNAQAKQHKIESEIANVEFDILNVYQKLKTLMNYNQDFIVEKEDIQLFTPLILNSSSTIQAEIYKLNSDYQNAKLELERNKLLPDFTLGYFNGSNKYAGSKNYHGFQVGVAIPLFYGEQKARISTNKISVEIVENMNHQNMLDLKLEYDELRIELMKYQQLIDNYNSQGSELSQEIVRASKLSYEAGEIDFFQFLYSIENSLEIEIAYLENTYQYNCIVLKMNYLTK
jgi:cobalt-zinc-cadmium resistance protein CzcA